MWRSMDSGEWISMTHECVELERAQSKGKKNCTLAQAQTEEVPAPAEDGRERGSAGFAKILH